MKLSWQKTESIYTDICEIQKPINARSQQESDI